MNHAQQQNDLFKQCNMYLQNGTAMNKGTETKPWETR